VSGMALNRREAAEFVGVSPTTFDKLVDRGHLPKARQIPETRRFFWLRKELEETLYEMPMVAANPYADVKL
jgi:predicted DNA-binding transcriptional regulator AlpA